MTPTLAVGPLGPWEILAILAVVVLLFGAKRLPDLARGVGKSIREFKKASSEDAPDPDESEEPKPGAKSVAPKPDVASKN